MRVQSMTVPLPRLLSLNGGAIDRPKNVPDDLQNRYPARWISDRVPSRFSFLTLRASCVTISKPTLSAHFAILREADLVASDKAGTTITYRLKLSVLEEALLAFSHTVGIGVARPGRSKSTRRTANAGP
jgi:DNA-binding transcriptional ArsR family regulator